MFTFPRMTPTMVTADTALTGRAEPAYTLELPHAVLEVLINSTPAGSELAYFALGCFWGAEKVFWAIDGVTNTAVGYQGGYTPNPTYEEVCTGQTGHAETVRVCFDPTVVTYEELAQKFFEAHDPTQGFRQGNDVGTQYRSALYATAESQLTTAEAQLARAQEAFTQAGYGEITTEIRRAPQFYYAEDYHQQYLVKNPNGYCPLHATGVKCSPPTMGHEQ